jgi:hypothetical protein
MAMRVPWSDVCGDWWSLVAFESQAMMTDSSLVFLSLWMLPQKSTVGSWQWSCNPGPPEALMVK